MDKFTRRKILIADGSLFLVAIIWGSGFIVNKNALDYMNPLYILVLRFSLASVLLGIIFYKKLLKINTEEIQAGAIIGVFLFLGFFTQTVGLKYTTVSKSAFITASYVVLVPFIFWLISKKRVEIHEILAALLCFIGIGILSLEKDFSISLGDGLTFLCAIFFAVHIISVGIYSKKHDPIKLIIIQFAMAAILSIIISFIFKVEFLPLTKEMGLSIGYLVIANTIIAFGIQNIAQKYTSSTHAAIILSLESVFGGLLSLIFLKEPFTIRFLIGCLAILISIITTETKWEFLREGRKSL